MPGHLALTRGPLQHFFGYYDKCPWSPDGRRMLCMETGLADRMPAGEEARVCLLDAGNPDAPPRRLAATRAWNWQQGAMAQWFPRDAGDRIIYNDLRDGRFVSVVLDTVGSGERVLPMPVAAVARDGAHALGLSFSRLHDTRPDYGYHGPPDPHAHDPCPGEDGIHLIDTSSGGTRLLLSLGQIAAFEPETLPPRARHWLNHAAFSPSGERFCFLHRFDMPGAGRFGTRLFTAALDGSGLRCLWDSHVSHFDWKDESHLLAWSVRRPVSPASDRIRSRLIGWLKKLPGLYRMLKSSSTVRSRIYGGAFRLFTDAGGDREGEVVGSGVLTEDGHCSYSPDGGWILTDTYPDASSRRNLRLYSPSDGRLIEAGSFFSPAGLTGPVRCDLHPRWNRRGDAVCIDSAHEGSRQMYLIDLRDMLMDGPSD